MAGLLVPDAGTVTVAGEDLTRQSERARTRIRRESIGYVFQFAELLPELTVSENVGLVGLLSGNTHAGRVEDALEATGIGHRSESFPAELSGGEAQRVAIARAIVNRPSVILADEPTGSLDAAATGEIITLLLEAAATFGAALIVVTHDLDVADRLGAIHRLEHGRLTVEPEPRLRR